MASVGTPVQHQPPRHSIPRKPIPEANTSAEVNQAAYASPTAHGTLLSPKESHSQVDSHRRDERHGFGWGWEIASLIFAYGCAVAIIVLLWWHEGSPLPDWPALVSINSVVAVLTAAMKASLLLPIVEGISELKWTWLSTSRRLGDFERFDAASRGPLGAIKFLIQWPHHLATLGAALIIAAIAIDPFTQQVVQYYTCQTSMQGITSSVARVNTYNVTNLNAKPFLTKLDDTMTAALFQGLLEPPANSSVGIPFVCATGNCTLGGTTDSVYRSLAICSHVEDFSDLVTGNASKSSDVGPGEWIYMLGTGPDNLTITNGGGGGGDILTTNVIGDLSQLAPGTRPQSIFSLIGLTLTGPAGDIAEALDSGSMKPFAFGAYIYPCINTYRSSGVQEFIVQETIESSVPLAYNVGDFSLAGNYPAVSGLDCTPSPIKAGNKTTPTSTLPSGDVILNENGSGITGWYDPGCVWQFWSLSAMAINQTLQEKFFTQTPASTEETEPQYLTVDGDVADDVLGDLWIVRLYSNHNANISSVRAYMDGLANAMTAVVRTHGDSGTVGPAQGIAFQNQTCVGVAWPWLALPGAILLFAAVFLLCTMIHVARRVRRPDSPQAGRGIWKSSPLPLLWCGLPEEMRQRAATMNTAKEMRKMSDGVYVSLGRSDRCSAESPAHNSGWNNSSPTHGGHLESMPGRWTLVEQPGPLQRRGRSSKWASQSNGARRSHQIGGGNGSRRILAPWSRSRRRKDYDAPRGHEQNGAFD